MLLRIQLQLNQLPSYEARRCQSRYCGQSVGVFVGLQGMITPKASVDLGDRGVGAVEERFAFTANETVEGCELDGRKGLGVPWRYIATLHSLL